MVPFENFGGTVSYSHSIATMAVVNRFDTIHEVTANQPPHDSKDRVYR